MNDMHPYTLDVIANPRAAGLFEWVIRKNGKLVQRSDRAHRSEADARKMGEKEVERQFAGAHSDR